MFKIKQITTKKGAKVPCLVYDSIFNQYDIYVSFDVNTMSRISGLSIRDIYIADEDIPITE